jgi:imidazolonepropionase
MLLPGAVFFNDSERYPPARMLIDQGAAVALATNFNPENGPSQNMQMTIALACRSMNMSPAEAITAATLNAAYAVGQGERTGSREVGKSADLLIVRVPDYREISYHFGINLMDRVIQRGMVIAERSEVKWPPH